MFLIIDGIDGSGKSTVIDTWADVLASQGKKIFSLKTYWREHHRHPEPAELAPYDVILSAEPSTVWAGAAIREEMIRHGSSYSGLDIAHAYALDRLVLYQRLIIPLREQGKIIIQDRSVSTSLCYQPLQDKSLTMDMIAAIPGNAFALAHAPDHLVLADAPVPVAMTRLGGRHEKNDQAIFEQADFLEQAREQFLSEAYQARFRSRGTSIHILNTASALDIMKADARAFLATIFSF